MLRLTRDDFGDPHELAKFASTAGISLEEFRDQFYYMIEQDMLYRTRDTELESAVAGSDAQAGNDGRDAGAPEVA